MGPGARRPWPRPGSWDEAEGLRWELGRALAGTGPLCPQHALEKVPSRRQQQPNPRGAGACPGDREGSEASGRRLPGEEARLAAPELRDSWRWGEGESDTARNQNQKNETEGDHRRHREQGKNLKKTEPGTARAKRNRENHQRQRYSQGWESEGAGL